jgi:hypothetical protein
MEEVRDFFDANGVYAQIDPVFASPTKSVTDQLNEGLRHWGLDPSDAVFETYKVGCAQLKFNPRRFRGARRLHISVSMETTLICFISEKHQKYTSHHSFTVKVRKAKLLMIYDTAPDVDPPSTRVVNTSSMSEVLEKIIRTLQPV